MDKEKKFLPEQSSKNAQRQTTKASQDILKRIKEKNLKKESLSKEIVLENKKQMELTGDMAIAWEALKANLCTQEDIVAAFFEQASAEEKKTNGSILDILQSHNKLSPEAYQQLKTVQTTQKELPEKMPQTSHINLMLGQILVERNHLNREQIQKFLRIQGNLYKIGISTTLENIIVGCHALDETAMYSLLLECKKKQEEIKKNSVTQKNIKKQTIVSAPTKKYPVLIFSFLFLFFFFFFTILFLKKESKKNSLRETSEIIRPMAKQNIPSSSEIKKREKEILLDQKKSFEEKNIMKDFFLWGNFWIPKKQKELLLKKWAIGSYIENFTLELLSQEWFWKIEKEVRKLYWKGNFNIPKGISLKMQLKICSPFYKDRAYLYREFNTNIEGFPSIVIPFSIKNFVPTIYCLSLELKPSKQTDFAQYFLSLKENKIWETFFILDEKKSILGYCKNCMSDLEEILFQSQKKYETMKLWMHNKQKSSTKEWTEKSKIFLQEFYQIQETLQKVEKNSLLPLYPQSKSKIEEMLAKLYQIFTKWHHWQNSFEKEPPDLFQEKAEYEILYEKSLYFLHQENKNLLEFLKKNKIIEIKKR